jgi:YgiT-type zinc finger domain-containing protein
VSEEEEVAFAATTCGTCGKATIEKVVQVTMWSGDRLVVIEDVPARICLGCQEQYYDADTGEEILRLSGEGFPREKMVREVTVPVFRLPPRAAIPPQE